jgi:nucleoside-diphosphate-sugar epimerase
VSETQKNQNAKKKTAAKPKVAQKKKTTAKAAAKKSVKKTPATSTAKKAAPAKKPAPAPAPPALKTFLVTGASGFVGTHMVNLLVKKGYNVIAADLVGTDGGKFAELGVPFIPVDISRKDSLQNTFEHVDAVMHVAAIFDYTVSWQDLWRVNVKGTRNVCESAAEQGVKKLVYFSSCDIYGDPAKIPADESTKIRPNHNYGESKFLGEREAFKVGLTRGLDVAVLRPAALYGPGSTYGAILLINMLYKGLLPGIPGDGKTMVHMVHVKDVVSAALFLAEHPDSSGREFNLSDDTPVQLQRIVEHAASILEFKVPKLHIPKFLAEAAAPFVKTFAKITSTSPVFNEDMLNILYHNHVFDSSRIHDLGYELIVPDVIDGLSESLEWYKDHDILKRNIAFKRVRLKELFD